MKLQALLPVLVLTGLVACGEKAPAPSPEATGIPESYWSDVAPTDARPAGQVRADAKDGAEVVLRGRVKDFVDGLAAFTVIDETLKSCREMEGDACETPWDYCCVEAPVIAQNTVTVELRSGDRPFRTSVAGFHGLDHLDPVVVQGTVKRLSGGNVTVVAKTIARSR